MVNRTGASLAIQDNTDIKAKEVGRLLYLLAKLPIRGDENVEALAFTRSEFVVPQLQAMLEAQEGKGPLSAAPA